MRDNYLGDVCTICKLEYTPKKEIPATVCEACWKENQIDNPQTDCEICGDPYIKRDQNNKFSICDKCLFEHVFSNKDTVVYHSHKKNNHHKHKNKHKGNK